MGARWLSPEEEARIKDLYENSKLSSVEIGRIVGRSACTVLRVVNGRPQRAKVPPAKPVEAPVKPSCSMCSVQAAQVQQSRNVMGTEDRLRLELSAVRLRAERAEKRVKELETAIVTLAEKVDP